MQSDFLATVIYCLRRVFCFLFFVFFASLFSLSDFSSGLVKNRVMKNWNILLIAFWGLFTLDILAENSA